MGQYRESRAILDPIYEQWQNYIKAFDKSAPPTMKGIKQTAGINWAWMETETNFINSTIFGVLFAVGCSFVILVYASRNIILVIVQILTVAIIIMSVITVVVVHGWEFGLSESLGIIMVLCLSVDYIVHVGMDYYKQPMFHRKKKMKQTFKNLGPSVLSGSLTTLGSGAFLFAGQAYIFQKMGTIIVCTVLFSFLGSMLFFGSMMHLFGPQAGFGSLMSTELKNEDDQPPSASETE